MDSSPFYDPPYDSPIEDSFAHNIVKYLDETVRLRKQLQILTDCGVFRLDFVAQKCGRSIGFECDGMEFHSGELAYRDEWRDALILGTGLIAGIYRLPGKDLTYRMNDCLYILSLWEPDLFSERGRINLARLASKQLSDEASRQYNVGDLSSDMWFQLTYRIDSENESDLNRISIERRMLENPPSVAGQHWQGLYAFVEKEGGGQLDDVMARYRSMIRSAT